MRLMTWGMVGVVSLLGSAVASGKELSPREIYEQASPGVVMVLVMAAASLGWCISISRLPQALTPMLLATIESLLTNRRDKIGVYYSERANLLLKDHPLQAKWLLQ